MTHAVETPAQAGPAEWVDERTGVLLHQLTAGVEQARAFCETVPMWTDDGEYLLFHGQRNGNWTPHALYTKTGLVRSLLDEESSWCALDVEHGRLYYIHGHTLKVVSVGLAFRRVAVPREVTRLPDKIVGVVGGLSLDFKGDMLYAGMCLEADKRWGVVAYNFLARRWQMVKEVDFPVGSVQANPAISRMVMFCHDGEGDVPQRMWLVSATGAGLRPFYKETYNEWVTHEVWWGGIRALFTIHPYDDEHRRQTHGLLSADLASGRPTVHCQFEAWHCHGSPDGQWIVADDRQGTIWLVKAVTGQRRLLTRGHAGPNGETHPHPSFAPDGKSVVFTSARSGKEHVCQAMLPEWESLPEA